MSYTKDELQEMLKNPEISSEVLQTLLKAREAGEIDFVLMDIREEFEFKDSSIVGADMLIPTSVIGNHVNKFDELKDKHIILYCRTGARTGQVKYALNNMGYINISHLSHGIMSYFGEKVSNAPIPNQL